MTQAHTRSVQTRKIGASGEEKIGEEGGAVESEQGHMTTNVCTTTYLLHNAFAGVLRTHLVLNMDRGTHKLSTLTAPAILRYRA